MPRTCSRRIVHRTAPSPMAYAQVFRVTLIKPISLQHALLCDRVTAVRTTKTQASPLG
jgi:hypothetical protein